MTFFDRVAGTQEPKVPVWSLRTDIPRVLNQEPGFGIAELAAKYECDQAETAELGEYVTHAGTIITDRVAALMADGISQANAIEMAKAVVDSIVSHALLRVEQGTMDVDGLRAYLGMD